MTHKVILDAFEAPKFDDTPVDVVKWYDRHTRSYCIQIVNAEGDQIGDAQYVGNAAEARYVQEMLLDSLNLHSRKKGS